MTVYTENLKDTTRKLLELINDFSKVAGYKVNIKKPVAFLYTNIDQKEQLSKQFYFTITSKRIKYLGTNLPKEAKTCTLKTVRW